MAAWFGPAAMGRPTKGILATAVMGGLRTLLPGTPGTLARRGETGCAYWYRVYYPVPGKQSEDFVGRDGRETMVQDMRHRMEFSAWVAPQMPFVAVPGMPASTPATSAKLPGVQGFRVDLLAAGPSLGAVIRVPELQWCAQSVPYFDHLLDEPESAAVLAGGHCVPVRVPQAARLVRHKLHAGTQRRGFSEKAAKDRRQALILAAVLAEEDPGPLRSAFDAADPATMHPVRRLLGRLSKQAQAHPEAVEILELRLGR